MNENNFSEVGNKFSLRSSFLNRIQRIDAISNLLGRLGDILVSTIMGVLLGGVVAGVGVAFAIAYLVKTPATLTQNIAPAIFMIIGFIIVGLNIMFTNPALGSQFVVSLRYLINKVKTFKTSDNKIKIETFRLSKHYPELVEAVVGNKRFYALAFRARGVVSRVSFESDLAQFASLNLRLLTNIENTTQYNCINTIQPSTIQPMAVAKNATQSMLNRRQEIYENAKNVEKNQQLSTLVVFTDQSPEKLLSHSDLAENAFNEGLTVGYTRLTAKQTKKELNEFYD